MGSSRESGMEQAGFAALSEHAAACVGYFAARSRKFTVNGA
ncbi:hypothetical protein [Christensenella massiliensis]|uniref:Uncharacterized protein n=1 Tax=Christensenella massiliensis TaxID=1805714 RepID=A0AAU8AAZ1_9FIRM